MPLALIPPGRSFFDTRKLLSFAALLLVLGIGLTVFFGSWYTVDQGERTVLLRNGAYVATVGPGLHFKMPWIDDARAVSIQTQTRSYEKVNSYSADQQPADIKISVTFHADPDRVDALYAKFGWPVIPAVSSRLIDPRVYQELKVVFGRYTAVSAIQERAKLNADVYTAIKDLLAGNPEVILESVQIENIDFSAQYVQSIEARMQAEIEVQRIQQQYQQQEVQAKITVVNAQAAADAKVAAAKADAQSIQLRGDAEALAIKARGDALKQNPDLVALTAAEKWNGVLPTTMVPGGAVPFVGVK